MPRGLAVLLTALVVTMIGFGVTLPVLPFYIVRLVEGAGPAGRDVAAQVGLLTGVYPLIQLIAAPLWGRWSDAVGRRPLVLIGIAGAALGQVLFAFATSLPSLYLARVLGGLLSSAILPAAAAYVVDTTAPEARGRGMAWLGSAVSLGVILGPAVGGALAQVDLHLRVLSRHVAVPSFSVPFLASAALSLAALAGAWRWLPESLPAHGAQRPGVSDLPWFRLLGRRVALLLVLGIVAQFGLAMFETTFALYARRMWKFGPAEVGIAFMVCGLIMAVAQTGAVMLLSRRLGEVPQVAAGFALMGTSLGVLLAVGSTAGVLVTVAALALGMALIAPNLAALVSQHRESGAGVTLGAQNAANSLGQLGGTLTGAMLFGWNMGAPFSMAGGLLVVVGAVLAWRTLGTSRRRAT